MRLIFITSLIISVFTLSGCFPPVLQKNQLVMLNKGMLKGNIAKRFNVPPEKEYSVSVRGRPYIAEFYTLYNGVSADLYVLAYDQKQKLLYWGYPDEYRKHPGKDMQEFIDKALAKFSSNNKK